MRRILVWIQVLSTLGVLIGILLVVAQLRQNESLLRLQLATDLRINRDADRLSTRGEEYAATLAKLTTGEPLNTAELHQFHAHAVSLYEELDLRRMLFDVGVFKGDWRHWLRMESCLLLDNPTGKAWIDFHLALGDDEIIEEFDRRVRERCEDLDVLRHLQAQGHS